MSFKYIFEDLEKFDITDYQDDVINNHDIQNIIFNYKPETYNELIDLVQERYDENHESPFLLDIDTSLIEDMSGLFEGFNKTIELDLSTWNTSNVETMESMFYACTQLKTLNISSFNTANLENMNYMFSYCRSLTDIDLTHLDISNVTMMKEMFSNCIHLNTVNLSNLDFSNVYDITKMFSQCNSIKLLDFSIRVNTSNMNQLEYFNDIFMNTDVEKIIISKDFIYKMFDILPKSLTVK